MLTDELGGLESAREALARERLEELQALARTYRNWSVKELAHALGRQPGRLVPESGMPKIDLVVGLAKALDWPVEAVVDHLMKPAGDARRQVLVQDAAADYARLYNESLECRRRRDFNEAIRLAVRAGAVADTPTRRAAAFSLEAFSHEAAGSYVEAMRCLREAIRIDGVALSWRLLHDAKLANMLFMQGNPTQAIGISSSVIEYISSVEGDDETLRTANAIALWVRAQSLRSSIPLANFEAWRPLASSAREQFIRAAALTAELSGSASLAPRNDCLSLCLEPLVLELDSVCDDSASQAVIERLVTIVREGAADSAGVDERKAWGAIALANSAKRFVTDEAKLHGLLEFASAALRAHAVATSNWYFAHRHLQLDAERRRSLVDRGCASRALDATEARLVAGVLGQIPSARSEAGAYFALYGAPEGARP